MNLVDKVRRFEELQQRQQHKVGGSHKKHDGFEFIGGLNTDPTILGKDGQMYQDKIGGRNLHDK